MSTPVGWLRQLPKAKDVSNLLAATFVETSSAPVLYLSKDRLVHHGPMLPELQFLADELALRLKRDVAVDDPRSRLLVHSAHHGQMDTARTESILRLTAPAEVVAWVMTLHLDRAPVDVVRLPPQPKLAMMARVVAPLRTANQMFGYLWIIDADQSLSDAQLKVVAEVAHSAAMVLHREQLLDDLEAGRRRELLRDLLCGDNSVRISAAQTLKGLEGWPSGPFQALVLQIPPSLTLDTDDAALVIDQALTRAARKTMPQSWSLHLTRVDHGLLVIPAGRSGQCNGHDVAKAARAEIQAGLASGGVTSALGGPVADVENLESSYAEALRALSVAKIIPAFGVHVNWTELGVYQILIHLPLNELPTNAISPRLLALLDSPGGRELVRTVEVYLDEAANVRRSAAQLNIHRTSLYYRLGRFTELTGLDLSDGGDRLSVHLGLKLARLAGVPGQASPRHLPER